MIFKNAWIPNIPDIRDRVFAMPLGFSLPNNDSAEYLLPPVWNQSAIGSCVPHGVASIFMAAAKKDGDETLVMPSRLQLYYDARKMQGWEKADTGCYIRDAIKSVVKSGVADESLWPYNIKKFKVKPTKAVYANALLNQGIEYQSIDNTKPELIKYAITQGLPVVFGAMLYESFYKLDNFTVPMPKRTDKTIGGHAMVIAAYCDHRRAYKVRNSYDTTWGDKGYHWMPYDYIHSKTLCDDFWVLKTVEIN